MNPMVLITNASTKEISAMWDEFIKDELWNGQNFDDFVRIKGFVAIAGMNERTNFNIPQ